jgi:hypothetical protein
MHVYDRLHDREAQARTSGTRSSIRRRQPFGAAIEAIENAWQFIR